MFYGRGGIPCKMGLLNAMTFSFFAFKFAFIPGICGISSLRFFAIGDMGGIPVEPYYTYVERSTAKEMGRLADLYKPAMIFELGDNFYFDGVNNLNDKRFKETFENVYTDPSLQIPWYLIAGNHDHRGNVSAQIEYSKLSKKWNFPNLYYYKEFPISNKDSVGIVFIDTVELCGNTYDGVREQPNKPLSKARADEQWQFIESTLKTSKSNFLFVAGHFPIISIAEHGPSQCLIDRLLPLIDKYNCTGYLSGHDHNLQHLRTVSKTGMNIDYFVTGMANFIDPSTANKNSVPKGSSLFHDANLQSKGGFLYAEATSKNITMTFIDSNGKHLYSTHLLPRY